MVGPLEVNLQTDEKLEKGLTYSNCKVQLFDQPFICQASAGQQIASAMGRKNSGGNEKQDKYSKNISQDKDQQTTSLGHACTPLVYPPNENVGGGGDGQRPNRINKRNGGCANSMTITKTNARLRLFGDNFESRQQEQVGLDKGEREYQSDNVCNHRANLPLKLNDSTEGEFAIRKTIPAEKSHSSPHMEQHVPIFQEWHRPTIVADSLKPQKESNLDEQKVRIEDDEQQGTSRGMAHPEMNEDDELEQEPEDFRFGERSSDEVQENSSWQDPERPGPIQENTTLVESKKRLFNDKNHNSSNGQTIAENSLTNSNSRRHIITQKLSPVSFPLRENTFPRSFHGLQGKNQSQICIAQEVGTQRACVLGEERKLMRTITTGISAIEGSTNAANTSKSLQLGHCLVEPNEGVDQNAETEYIASVNKNVNNNRTDATGRNQIVLPSGKVIRKKPSTANKPSTVEQTPKSFQKTTNRKSTKPMNTNVNHTDSVLDTKTTQTPDISQTFGFQDEGIGGKPQPLISASGNTSEQNPKREMNAEGRKIEGTPPPATPPGNRPLALVDQCSSIQERNPKITQMNNAEVLKTLTERCPDLLPSDRNSQSPASLWLPDLADENLETGQVSSVDDSDVTSQQNNNSQVVWGTLLTLGSTGHERCNLFEHPDSEQLVSESSTKPEDQQPVLLDDRFIVGSSRSNNTQTFGGTLFGGNTDYADLYKNSLRECSSTEQPYPASLPSILRSQNFDLDPLFGLFSERLRVARRTEERAFLHPEGQCTGRIWRECLHCGQRIFCLLLPICGYCERIWCGECHLWCEETEDQDIDLHGADTLPKKASSG